MKKMKYIAPQVEVIRFDTEDVLSDALISSTGNAPEAGKIGFGNTSKVDLNWN